MKTVIKRVLLVIGQILGYLVIVTGVTMTILILSTYI
jgi:hypothetical protein